MKATDLARTLQEMAEHFGDREVYTEGCDCHGTVDSVTIDAISNMFLIKRPQTQPGDNLYSKEGIRDAIARLRS